MHITPEFPRCGVEPGKPTDAAEQQDKTRHRNDDHHPGWHVSNQPLGRPVVCIRDDLTGALGHTRPGRPEEEGSQLARVLRCGHRPRRHRVALAQGVVLRVQAKQSEVVRLHGVNGLRPQLRYGYRFCRRVIGVRPHFTLEPSPKGGLLFSFERLVATFPSLVCPVVKQPDGLTVQPVGGPVRGRVGAMTPDGPEFVSAN